MRSMVQKRLGTQVGQPSVTSEILVLLESVSEPVGAAVAMSSISEFCLAVFIFLLRISPCVIGIPFNILSIVVLQRHDSFKHTTRFLLQNLAVADMLFLVCDVAGYLVTVIFGEDWASFLCFKNLVTFSLTASVWSVVVVTAERYIAVTRPLRAVEYLTMFKARRAVVGVWIGSLLFGAPRLLEFPGVIPPSWQRNALYSFGYVSVLHMIVNVLIPLTILIFFNCHLIAAIRHHATFVRRQDDIEISTIQGQPRRQQQPAISANEVRATVAMVAVVIVFIVCQLPEATIRFVFALMYLGYLDYPPFFGVAVIVTGTLVAMNSSVNFFIYVVSGRRFRELLREGRNRCCLRCSLCVVLSVLGLVLVGLTIIIISNL